MTKFGLKITAANDSEHFLPIISSKWNLIWDCQQEKGLKLESFEIKEDIFSLYFLFANFDKADLAMTENWSAAKEQSSKRFFIPSIDVKIKPLMRELLDMTELFKHDYDPYFTDPVPSRTSEDPLPSDEIIHSLQEFLPVREMTIKTGLVSIAVDFGSDVLTAKFENIDIANKRIMYPESFTRAIYRAYDNDAVCSLEFYTDAHWKFSVEKARAIFSSYDILNVHSVVINIQKKILPVFWPNSRSIELKAFMNKSLLLVSPIVIDRLLFHVASFSQPELNFAAKASTRSSVVIALETLSVAYAEDVCLGENVKTFRFFLDRISTELYDDNGQGELIFENKKELIDFCGQLPVDNASQVILIGKLASFSVSLNLAFIDFVKEISRVISQSGNRNKQKNKDSAWKPGLNFVTNLTWNQSSVKFKANEHLILLKLPRGRICNAGMSNLDTSTELPTWIDMPIHLSKGPISITVSVAELQISSSIGGSAPSDVLHFPSLSATFSVSNGEANADGRATIFISLFVELQYLEISFSPDLICLLSFIIENILSNEKAAGIKRVSSQAIPLSPDSGKSFLSEIPASYTQSVSDVWPDISFSEVPQTAASCNDAILDLTMKMKIPEIRFKLKIEDQKLLATIKDLSVDFSSNSSFQQLTCSVLIVTVAFGCQTIFTNDGRGKIQMVGEDSMGERRSNARTKGLKIVWTKAKTKNWHQREKIICDDNSLLADFVEEIYFSSGPVDVVLDKNLLFELAKLTVLFPDLPPSSTMPYQGRFPMIQLDLQELVVFIRVEDYSSLGDTFYFFIERLTVNPSPEFPLDRVIINQDAFASAEEKGLLSTPGSVIENIQFQGCLTGLSAGSCNWSASVANRWLDCKPFEAQNPALEWNMKKDLKSERSQEVVYPLLSPTDVSAILAPAIYYKSNPIAAHSLELSLGRKVLCYGSIPQLHLVYKMINSALSKVSSFQEIADVYSANKRRRLGLCRRRRRRTTSESRRKSSKIINCPLYLLATGVDLSAIVYDSNGEFSVEPFFHFIVDQPSVNIEFLSLKQSHSVKVVCFDISLKTYNGKPITKNRPFLPEEKDFSISWISSREGMESKSSFCPLLSFNLSNFMRPEKAQTLIDFNRCLKFVLDFPKLAVAAKFLSKLKKDIRLHSRRRSSSRSESINSTERDSSLNDLLPGLLRRTKISFSQIVVVAQESAISLETSIASCEIILTTDCVKKFEACIDYKGLMVRLKEKGCAHHTILRPACGKLKINGLSELHNSSHESVGNLKAPRVFLNLDLSSFQFVGSRPVVRTLSMIANLIEERARTVEKTESKEASSSLLSAQNGKIERSQNDLHSGLFEFTSEPLDVEKAIKSGSCIFSIAKDNRPGSVTRGTKHREQLNT